VIRKSVKKTDKHDARALALFLSKDLLPETRLKSASHRELASITQTRDLLVKQRTRLLNNIHGLYNGHGLKIKKAKLGSKRALLALDMVVFSVNCHAKVPHLGGELHLKLPHLIC